jgi:hypothetical protein
MLFWLLDFGFHLGPNMLPLYFSSRTFNKLPLHHVSCHRFFPCGTKNLEVFWSQTVPSPLTIVYWAKRKRKCWGVGKEWLGSGNCSEESLIKDRTAISETKAWLWYHWLWEDLLIHIPVACKWTPQKCVWNCDYFFRLLECEACSGWNNSQDRSDSSKELMFHSDVLGPKINQKSNKPFI